MTTPSSIGSSSRARKYSVCGFARGLCDAGCAELSFRRDAGRTAGAASAASAVSAGTLDTGAWATMGRWERGSLGAGPRGAQIFGFGAPTNANPPAAANARAPQAAGRFQARLAEVVTRTGVSANGGGANVSISDNTRAARAPN